MNDVHLFEGTSVSTHGFMDRNREWVEGKEWKGSGAGWLEVTQVSTRLMDILDPDTALCSTPRVFSASCELQPILCVGVQRCQSTQTDRVGAGDDFYVSQEQIRGAWDCWHMLGHWMGKSAEQHPGGTEGGKSRRSVNHRSEQKRTCNSPALGTRCRDSGVSLQPPEGRVGARD